MGGGSGACLACFARLALIGLRYGRAADVLARTAHSRPRAKLGGGNGACFALCFARFAWLALLGLLGLLCSAHFSGLALLGSLCSAHFPQLALLGLLCLSPFAWLALLSTHCLACFVQLALLGLLCSTHVRLERGPGHRWGGAAVLALHGLACGGVGPVTRWLTLCACGPG